MTDTVNEEAFTKISKALIGVFLKLKFSILSNVDPMGRIAS